ncbi:ABC transporter substrate-binding protein [Rhodomicrobium sp. Az07]|nr:ABC transporter substrate-binding protein [Rhodomicrobium sp. Az07]
MRTLLAARAALILLAVLLATAMSVGNLAAETKTREITDMIGRKVVVPAEIRKIYSSTPPTTYVLYAIAPDTVAGLNLNMTAEQRRLMRPETANLPVLGGTIGMGRQVNPEEILALKPDIVIAWANSSNDVGRVEARFAKLGLPVVFLNVDKLEDYPAAFKYLGELLGRQERANELASYISGAMSRVAAAVGSVPQDQRIKVYYAESPDGLATECDTSFHVEPVILAAGNIVHRCQQTTHMGMERVSLEQIVGYQPALILSQDRAFAASVADNPNWRNVKAVKDGRIVVVPNKPFNWLDRPPSFMRALGIQWLANMFYPERYPFDLRSETKAFYKLFIGVELSEADVDAVLN